jgi:hypothetical protein
MALQKEETEMSIVSPERSAWKLYLSWIITNLLGFGVGMLIAFFLKDILGIYAAFAIFGLLVGFVQFMILKRYVSISGWWTVISSLGAVFSLAFLDEVVGKILQNPIPYNLDWAVCGIILGISLFPFLRPHMRQSGFWILASTLGWGIGGGAVFLLSNNINNLLYSWFNAVSVLDAIIFATRFALIGVIYGLVSGIFLLVGFVKLRREENERKPRGWLSAVNLVVLGTIIFVVHILNTPSLPYDLSNPPEFGTLPECQDLPPLECSGDPEYCGELISFEPSQGYGYTDFPENGETWENQYRSYLRRDLVMLIQYASAKVACMTSTWDYQEIKPIGLVDMSEKDGSIPGSSIGSPGHPAGTHEGGVDIDIAYYQVDARTLLIDIPDGEVNRARIVCGHSIFHFDVFHCAESPIDLDPWRNALFIAYLAEHPRIRVIGVDGQVGLLLEPAFKQLVQAGWLEQDHLDLMPYVYEPYFDQYGFYKFHHHHMHISIIAE